MRRMKSLLFVAVTSIILTGQMTTAGSAQEKIKLSIGHITASDSYLIQKQIWPLRDALEKTGLVEVTLYGTGSPYSNPTKFSELVEKGVIDSAYGVPQFEGGRYAINLLFGNPLFIQDPLKGAKVYNRLAHENAAVAKEFSPNHLMFASLGDGEVIHSRTPIRSIEDFKGLRVLGTAPGTQAILREAGASVVALPISSVYVSLQKGVVDAVSSLWANVRSFNLFEVTTGHYELGGVATPIYMIINQQKYASLPAPVKKVIDDFSSDQAATAFTQAFLDIASEVRDEAIKKGKVVAGPTREEKSVLFEKFKHITDANSQELDKKGLPGTEVVNAFLKMLKE